MSDPDELLQIAASVARSAGELLLDGLHRARTRVTTKSSRTDMVTEMDLASESLIATSLHRQRPGDAIVGEEGARREGTAGIRWIVDPLDGTTNYLYGWPAFAVSIAAEVDGLVAVGVVHDPSHGETFAAVRGSGAWLSNADAAGARSALRLDPPPKLGDALIGTGFNYDPGLRARQAEVLTHVLPAVRDVRGPAPPPSTCAGSPPDASTASSRPGCTCGTGPPVRSSPAESGASVGDLEGGPPSRSMTLAAAPELAARLRALLLDAGAAGGS